MNVLDRDLEAIETASFGNLNFGGEFLYLERREGIIRTRMGIGGSTHQIFTDNAIARSEEGQDVFDEVLLVRC